MTNWTKLKSHGNWQYNYLEHDGSGRQLPLYFADLMKDCPHLSPRLKISKQHQTWPVAWQLRCTIVVFYYTAACAAWYLFTKPFSWTIHQLHPVASQPDISELAPMKRAGCGASCSRLPSIPFRALYWQSSQLPLVGQINVWEGKHVVGSRLVFRCTPLPLWNTCQDFSLGGKEQELDISVTHGMDKARVDSVLFIETKKSSQRKVPIGVSKMVVFLWPEVTLSMGLTRP